MRFFYDKRDMPTLDRAEDNCWLLANGLGGYASTSAAFSVSRCDQGLLIAADSPSRRYGLVHRLSETLTTAEGTAFLSAQRFAGDLPPEDGWRRLSSFVFDGVPVWEYQIGAVTVRRRIALDHGFNRAAAVYTVENRSGADCVLRVTPSLQFAPKGHPPQKPFPFVYRDGIIRCNGVSLYISSNERLDAIPARSESLFYRHDAENGREESGLGLLCCRAEWTVPAGETRQLELTFSTEPTERTGGDILRDCEARQRALPDSAPLRDPAAKELARAADAYIAYRASTDGKTIIAGYPFFGDWGRDTMISLPGCVLATGRYEEARSILRTFLAYEKDGLLPNLFPEGAEVPEYNSVDAPLLLINGVWLYFQKTGDNEFVREAWPVLERIVQAYARGTRYAIAMDGDGLIRAGSGLDQVTWMDVRVDGFLPTPRHGKPVEINAYWYNALCVLSRLAPLAGADGTEYATLAEKVKSSFNEKFWMEDRGWLKDVLSGTRADTQLRCNQIWAVSMPFSMLPPDRERRVVEAVEASLYTDHGLRTLSPDDPDFHPAYGGPLRDRDLAYHQGTVWPFPLGGYYLAWLKVHGNTPKAAARVRERLSTMPALLKEGCAGHLPEIYDGLEPGPSRGCFAQAWSVGELLRVYEALEQIEQGGDHHA